MCANVARVFLIEAACLVRDERPRIRARFLRTEFLLGKCRNTIREGPEERNILLAGLTLGKMPLQGRFFGFFDAAFEIPEQVRTGVWVGNRHNLTSHVRRVVPAKWVDHLQVVIQETLHAFLDSILVAPTLRWAIQTAPNLRIRPIAPEPQTKRGGAVLVFVKNDFGD